jgi:asparagine synthase (glutamine-hydrolysing)
MMYRIYGFNWNDEKLIRKMAGKTDSAGPGGNGIKVFPSFSIGSSCISETSFSGKESRYVQGQPVSADDGKLWIVYNGEVYNFPELKEELIAKGYKFNTTSDAEVVLKSYQEYGPACLEKFNGMFAFAIRDEEKKELFLARDRMGIKPLYYYLKDGKFIFGSDIKSILEADCVKKEVNLQSMYYYLGYEFVPAPDTMFKNIYKLRQGHYAILKDGNLNIKEYWDLNFKPEIFDEDEAADRIFKAIEESIKRRLTDNVPPGVFLSGGLDSSTITGFVARAYPEKIQTFSIGYRDKSFSELPYARMVSDFFNTEHNVLMIDPICPEDIEKILYNLDEPMTDLSTIPFYLICCKAREKVPVCLSGEGGDEMFVGYDRLKAARLSRYYNILPPFIRRKVMTPLILKLPDQPQKKGAINMLKRFVEGTLYLEDVGAMRWQYFLNPKIEKNIFNEHSRKNITFTPFEPVYYFSRKCNSNLQVDKDIYVDIKLTMADSVLMKVERMSTAASLQVRVPFLDHELAELCATIPANLKLNKLTTKYILRKALKKYDFLPEDIINRSKQGYSLPVKNWLREELKDYMIDLLKNSPVIKENFDSSYIDLLMKEHIQSKHNHNHILWALMNLSLWYKKFFL